MAKVFGYFHTDEAPTYQHSRPGMILIDMASDAQRVFHRAQGKHLAAVDARQIEPDGLCTGRKQELVVALLKGFTRLQILHGNGLSVRMDRRDLMAYLHLDPETAEKALRGLQGQFLRIFDDAADIIRQTAVGV